MENLVANVEPRKSSGQQAEGLIQIVDVLIGAIGYVRNKFIEAAPDDSAKKNMVFYIEQLLGAKLKYDTNAAASFNIWTFDVEVALKKRNMHKKKNRPKA